VKSKNTYENEWCDHKKMVTLRTKYNIFFHQRTTGSLKINDSHEGYIELYAHFLLSAGNNTSTASKVSQVH